MIDIFSDNWWKWLLSNYSYSIGLLIGLFKAWAIVNPNVPSNKIIDLFKAKQ
jgi:ABC-type uncharacterized transport system permease subunit